MNPTIQFCDISLISKCALSLDVCARYQLQHKLMVFPFLWSVGEPCTCGEANCMSASARGERWNALSVPEKVLSTCCIVLHRCSKDVVLFCLSPNLQQHRGGVSEYFFGCKIPIVLRLMSLPIRDDPDTLKLNLLYTAI